MQNSEFTSLEEIDRQSRSSNMHNKSFGNHNSFIGEDLKNTTDYENQKMKNESIASHMCGCKKPTCKSCCKRVKSYCCNHCNPKIYYPCCIRWKPCSLLVEFLGTLILVFVGALSTLVVGSNLIVVALAHGLILLALIASFGEISGGHFNPAVTLTVFLTQNINLWAALLYWVVQLLGAIVAGALLLVFFSSGTGLGTPDAVPPFSRGEAFAAELLGSSFLFHFIVFGVTYSNNAALSIGMGFVALELVFVPISGGAFNFARFLGPAVFSGLWGGWWIYLFAPFLGSILTAIVHYFCKWLKCLGKF
jgi:MIP family channel proteins